MWRSATASRRRLADTSPSGGVNGTTVDLHGESLERFSQKASQNESVSEKQSRSPELMKKGRIYKENSGRKCRASTRLHKQRGLLEIILVLISNKGWWGGSGELNKTNTGRIRARLACCAALCWDSAHHRKSREEQRCLTDSWGQRATLLSRNYTPFRKWGLKKAPAHNKSLMKTQCCPVFHRFAWWESSHRTVECRSLFSHR